MSSNTKKLAVLRSRTDHDLLILVQRELDRGFALVDVATSKGSPLFAQAERAFTRATQLLPKVSGLTQDDLGRLDAKVKELRSTLDRVPAYASVRSYTASF